MTVDTQKAFNAWQGCLAAKCQGALTDAAFQACFVSKCLSEYGSCFFLCDPDDDPWNQAAEKKALIECTTTQCAGLATEQALSSCYESECIEASTECFYAGDATCYEGFFGCYVNCPQGDQKCGNACLDSLSPEGAYDLFSWQDCRLAACDSNGDLAADSIDCWAASYLACADIIGSCTNKGWPGEATCAETTACAIACGGFGPSTQDCIGACIGELSPDGLAVTSAVWSCAIDACGTTGSALTSACVQAALKGQCAPEASACGIALP
jgi:hypothetical protein